MNVSSLIFLLLNKLCINLVGLQYLFLIASKVLLVEEKRKLGAKWRGRGIKLFVCMALNQSQKASQHPHYGAINENYVQREQQKPPQIITKKKD